MASIERRTTLDGKVHYRVKVRLEGFHSESATFKSVSNARQWALQTEAAMRNGRLLKEQQLQNMEERYISHADVRALIAEVRRLRRLKDFRKSAKKRKTVRQDVRAHKYPRYHD